MKRVKKFFASPKYFALFFCILYFIIGLILILSHEQIFDESNPWQIAKILTPGNFAEVMSNEPHAPLWYLILAPFAKLGLPLITTNFISLIIMTATVYLFLRFAPFRRITKLAFLLSSAFFFFFPVVSRDYCLVPLALTLIAIIYPTRHDHPIRYALALALLAQSHFIMAGLVAALAVVFVYEYIKHYRTHKKSSLGIRPLIIAGTIILLSALTLLPSAIGSFGSHRIIAESADAAVSYAEYSSELNSALFFVFVPIFEIFAVSILIYLIVNYRKLAIYFSSYLIVFFIATFFVYVNFLHFNLKTPTITSVLVFLYWLTFYDKKKPLKVQKIFHKIELVRYFSLKNYLAPVLFVTPILCTVPYSVASAAQDLTGQYPRGISRTIVSQLNSTENDAVIIVEGQSYVRSAMYYYIASISGDRVLYDAYYDRPLDYVSYDTNEIEFKGYDHLPAQLKEISEKYNTKNLYYITVQGKASCGLLSHVALDDTWEYAFTIELPNSSNNLDVFRINLDNSAQE